MRTTTNPWVVTRLMRRRTGGGLVVTFAPIAAGLATLDAALTAAEAHGPGVYRVHARGRTPQVKFRVYT